ncbi:hypothetical protein [Candidatus Wolbachia massiliensis]|uniref:Uncharacterized protein n=1 Tax=Candidatus Wolbachia massiliensis TaxID=1845000 RepID=A0A7M3U2N3_9RICK|nr:hypothetical protein [Candidatus Wolbachia massiliensis]QOD38668.1 hypothetical protein ID128_02235 [Candidatus Wolbachia massiliensis]
MSKEYDETKVKPVTSIPQGLKKINVSKVQNVLSRKEFKINFDDAKYAVKTVKTRFLETEQQPSKLRDLLKSIPVIGRLLAKIFTPEEAAYKKLQLQTDHSSEARNKTCINNKHTEEVGSRLKKSNVEQVDKEEKNLGP